MKIKKKNCISAGRLVLKPFSPSDREKLAELFMNPEVTETFMVPEYETEQEYLELADKLIEFGSVEDEKHLEYGVYCGDTLVGFVNDCGYNDELIEIGYVIHPDFWGRGYATEAVSALIPELWEMGFKRITAGFFENNPASRRVMEKCGMTLTERTTVDEYRGKKLLCRYCEIER